MQKTPSLLSLVLAAAGCGGAVDVDAASASTEQAVAVAPATCVTLSRQNGDDVEDATLARGANRGAALTLETDAARDAVVQFDLSAIPDAVNVESAVLSLTCRDNAKVGPARRAGALKRITRAWSEATVTQTQLQNGVSILPVGTIPLPNTNKQFAVTRSSNLRGLVTDWKRNPGSNHGVLVDEDATRGSICHSSEAGAGAPTLEVCFVATAECAGNNVCFDDATCVDVTGAGVTCGPCPIGFSGDGITCVSDTTCDDDPCGENKCRDLAGGGFACACGGGLVANETATACLSCPTGQTSLDGETCQADGCFDEPCFPGVSCDDVDGPNGFVCGACPQGFIGNGIECSPAPPPVCPPGTVGAFPACTPIFQPCPPGFVGVFPTCFPAP